ncbi:TonB-dependent receptor plug domain-containing protein [Thioflexithrix psekupsensis]|uniref:TonB-dependent receptor n=1 Tax=Thioflexithrix psekupsensis TaxID=1570016 RepID=A0A251X7T7_9GAMM|nr:TonB-dependent receptor [Thioflexithrix psekupsensis]OUD14041.1 hypothetical protein TPSD3_06795 [Thioflexithrix psekupsensis]
MKCHQRWRLFLSLFILFHTHPAFALEENEREKLKVLLSLSLKELMDVEIKTAGKTTEKISDVPASVILVTRQDIQRYGYTQLADILRHVSGMYLIDFYGLGGPAYGVRGYLNPGVSRNVIILINGIDHVFDYASSYFISSISIPVEAIDRIEIVRGPQSTIYGSGAFFGVINIITNELHQEQGVASSVTASLGTDGLHKRTARTSYKQEKANIVVNTGYAKTDGGDFKYSDLTTRDFGLPPKASTKGQLESAHTYLDISASYEPFSLTFTHHRSKVGGIATRPHIRTGSVRLHEANRLRLGYEIDLNDQWSLNSHVAYIEADTEFSYDSSIATDLWSVQFEKTRTYEAEMTLAWKSENLDGLLGAYYRYTPEVFTYLDVPSFPFVSFQNSTQRLEEGEALAKRALFSQFSYSLNDRWKWVAGLRLEEQAGYNTFSEYGYTPETHRAWNFYYEKQDIAVIPRLAVLYTPNDAHLLKLMYGKAINAPSFGQNTTAQLNDNSPRLKNEEIETLELNYLATLSPKYSITAHFFHNRLSGLFSNIGILTGSNQYTFSLRNAGRWSTNGVELGLQGNPYDNLQFELGFVYQHTKDVNNPNIKVSYSPSLLGQLKLSYQWDSQWSLGMTGYYVSKMSLFFDPTLANSEGGFGQYITGKESEGYFVLGANVRFQDWLSKGTSVSLRINNLLDQKVIHPTHTRNTWMDKGAIGEERQFIFSLGYDF